MDVRCLFGVVGISVLWTVSIISATNGANLPRNSAQYTGASHKYDRLIDAVTRIEYRDVRQCFTDSSTPPDNVTALLECMFSAQTSITFVQIGANDGSSFDPLYPLITTSEHWREWSGVLVEPVDSLFTVLVNQTYPERGFEFVRAAIYDQGPCPNATIDFFVHRRAQAYNLRNDTSAYRRGISGLSIERVGLTQQFVRTPVRCLSMRELYDLYVKKMLYETGRFDLLLVDVEGHDWPLIAQLSTWPRYSWPHCIVFEWRETYGTEPLRFLAKEGYHAMHVGNDVVAYWLGDGKTL